MATSYEILTAPQELAAGDFAGSGDSLTLLGALDNAFTGNADYGRQKELTLANNLFSAEEAMKAREFQERMSSTAHRREIADLQAAGLNPYLTLGNGAGSVASASAAASPSALSARSGRGFVDVGRLAMSAAELGVRSGIEEERIKQQRETTAAIKAQQSKNIQDAGTLLKLLSLL